MGSGVTTMNRAATLFILILSVFSHLMIEVSSQPFNRGEEEDMDMAKRGRGFDSMRGFTFGKRNFDEIDRARFSAFAKRNFDELDRAGFGAFHKRNFDELDRAGFGAFHKRNFGELDRKGFGAFNRYF